VCLFWFVIPKYSALYFLWYSTLCVYLGLYKCYACMNLAYFVAKKGEIGINGMPMCACYVMGISFLSSQYFLSVHVPC